MRTPTGSAPPATPTRRSVLTAVVAGTAAAVTGCTARATGQHGSSVPTAAAAHRTPDRTDPDVALALAALAAERHMLQALRATRRRHPTVAPALSDAVATHRLHVHLLAGAAPPDTSTDAAPHSAASTPTPHSGASRHGDRVPRRLRKALRRLARMEGQLGTTVGRDAFAADSGELARLLASIAASAAQHAHALRAASRTEGAR